VFEELGYDVSPHLVDGDFVEVKTEKQCTRLYIIPSISEQARQRAARQRAVRSRWAHCEPNVTRLADLPVCPQTGFAPQARKEISEYAWHWVSDLPIRGCVDGLHAGVVPRALHQPPTALCSFQECDARPRKILHGAPVREAAETGAAGPPPPPPLISP
jgi:hypothetical protein